MKLLLLCLTALVVSWGGTQAFASFPRNTLGFQDDVAGKSNITPQQFSQLVDAVIGIWQPLAQVHGATLTAQKLWNDPTVNASSNKNGNQWTVTMYGGLARRPEITPDGFVVVICHELGHLFGGYYFFPSDPNMAVEGEADYFATEVCAKKVFATFPQRNQLFRNGAPAPVEQRCNAAWKTQQQQDLCYRSAAAGLSLGTLLATIGNSPAPSFTTPDRSVVTQTFTDHPQAQCRLDTYFAGATCAAPWDPRTIPGLGVPQGNNSPQAEQAASTVSCALSNGQTLGVRPLCWFKPQLPSKTQLVRRF